MKRSFIIIVIILIALPVSIFAQDTWDRMVRPLTWLHHMFEVYEIKQCYDGGYAMIGSCQWYLDEVDMHTRTYIMKTDSEGLLEWSIQDSIDVTGEYNSFDPIGFVETQDHGFLVATRRSLFKYDEFGNRWWSHNEDYDTGLDMSDINETNDGNILLNGRINGVATTRKITQDNEIIWQKSYSIPGYQYSIVKTSISTSSNHIVQSVLAQTDYFEDWKSFLFKCDSLGDTLVVNRNISYEYSSSYNTIYEDLDTNNLYFTRRNKTLLVNSDCESINFFNFTVDASSFTYHSPNTLITRRGYYNVIDKDSFVEVYSSEETGTELGFINGQATFVMLQDDFMVTAGRFYSSDGINVIKTNSLGAVPNFEATTPKPNSMNLSNYPNPFNPTTTISFDLPTTQDVNLNIYNNKGQLVKTILNDRIGPGKHHYTWDGTNKNGIKASSGVYFYSLRLNNNNEVINKCVLLK